MPSFTRPYQDDFRKNATTSNVLRKPKDMVRHEILDGERKERIKLWITLFRRNPHIFISQYFGIKLHPYQILWIWVLQRSTLAYIVASRGTGKTWVIAVWALTLCVLYPGNRVVVASKTLKQAGLIIEKIKQMQADYPNVAREISSITMNQNGFECIFHCGSSIKCVPSSENARGIRLPQYMVTYI
jgi:phage terminase large subunit-like protein